MINNGVDIVYINSFENIINNDIRMKKIFTKNEIEIFKSNNYVLETIAGHFAAKEAFFKAHKMELSKTSFLDIEVLNNKNGSPYLLFNGSLKQLMKNKNYSLSISHDNEYAIAFISIY